MADIDNMRGDTLRVVEENTLDNMRGVTQRVISENSIDNTRGVTYRVYNVNGGSTPVIDELNVTPSTSAQVITAPSGTDGYSPVNVAAVTSSIDANITAGNIKKDVEILGVTGSYEGQTPTGTMYIISNGTYNVADKAIANVQVPTTAPVSYRAFQKDANGKLVSSTSTPWVPLPAGTTDISSFCFYAAYMNTPANVLSGALDLSSLTTISGSSAMASCFSGCTGITSVDLSSLTTISGSSAMASCFSGCTGITSVDLSSLTTVSGTTAMNSCFSGCTGITSVDLSSLTTIGDSSCAYMFQGCTGLISVDLSSLTTVNSSNSISGMFSGCTNLATATLSDALTKRNPSTILSGCPLTTNPYENCEYITSYQISGLCQGMHFVSTNMYAFEMVNVSNTYMFANNTYLEEAKFPVLTRWNGTNTADSMFAGCTNANFTDVYFPMLCVMRNAAPFTANSFPNQLTVHFRKDQQTLLQGTSGYPFGAASCVFDQIGTITVGGTNYVREEKCNETGYYAWHKASSKITVDGVDYTYNQQEITRNTVPVITGPMLYGWTNGSTTILTNSLKPQVGDYIYPAFNQAQSTTQSISAVDNEFIYTVDTAEPDVNDTAYSDAQGTVLGTISSIA